MGCCACGTCTDPDCYICVVMPKKFPPVVRCPRVVEAEGKKRQLVACRFVKGHPGPCKPSTKRITSTEDSWTTSD